MLNQEKKIHYTVLEKESISNDISPEGKDLTIETEKGNLYIMMLKL